VSGCKRPLPRQPFLIAVKPGPIVSFVDVHGYSPHVHSLSPREKRREKRPTPQLHFRCLGAAGFEPTTSSPPVSRAKPKTRWNSLDLAYRNSMQCRSFQGLTCKTLQQVWNDTTTAAARPHRRPRTQRSVILGGETIPSSVVRTQKAAPSRGFMPMMAKMRSRA
jgi:hypothetical protein